MSRRRFNGIAAALALLYLVIQAVYISRLPLVMDEFDGANEAYQLLELTPYKDYQPYKTVLGYYVELPPLLLTSDPWTGLMLSKASLALINTAAILASTIALAGIFSPPAAIAGQVLLIFVTTFLERSSELRVDMLTAWVGLASLLLLLRRRWLAAGVLAGLSFLVSQKGVYYTLSADAAGGIFWLVDSRDRRTFRDLIVFNVAVVAVIAVYIAAWGLVATPWTVFSNIFLSHNSIVFADLYTNLEEHWTRTLHRNWLFYWGALAGIIGLAAARWRGSVGTAHLMTASYAAMLFALCRWHKQPWPYFFVILIPTLMVVHTAALDILWRLPKWRTTILVTIAIAGVGWPLMYMPGILERDHEYQRHVIRLAHAMLGEGDTYLAGNDLIYDHHQAVTSLRRLGGVHLEAMKRWPPDQVNAIATDIEKARPKLIINDVRMQLLPQGLLDYLQTRFSPLSPTIEGYAPLVAANEVEFDIWFDGDYLIEPASGDAVIDGVPRAAGSKIALRRGHHRNNSVAAVRLRQQPAGLPADADPRMKGRQWLFARAYDY